MTPGIIIAILSLLATVIIGIVQIKISKEQGEIKSRLDKVENQVSQSGSNNVISGIVGNKNVGTISHNELK